MGRRPAFALLLCAGSFALLACGGNGGATGHPEEAPDRVASDGEETAAPEVEPGPPPALRLVAEAREGAVHLRVENRGDAATELAPEVTVERRGDDGAWTPAGATVALRFDCAGPAPGGCVPLAPGAVLLPPPWQGGLGRAQCDCASCADAPAGTYRLAVRSCDEAHRLETAPFALP